MTYVVAAVSLESYEVAPVDYSICLPGALREVCDTGCDCNFVRVTVVAFEVTAKEPLICVWYTDVEIDCSTG